jgi:hypothetical protein
MDDKYKILNDKYFDFGLFEDIFRVINEMKHPEMDMFNAGLASADGAIRRLREQYYETIKAMYAQEDIS